MALFRRFSFKEPRHSETVFDETCYLYRSMRPQRGTHPAPWSDGFQRSLMYEDSLGKALSGLETALAAPEEDATQV